jgi:hypothetical protein
LPVEAIFSKQPFQPLSQQVYGARKMDGAAEAGGVKERNS